MQEMCQYANPLGRQEPSTTLIDIYISSLLDMRFDWWNWILGWILQWSLALLLICGGREGGRECFL